jgi:ATP-dependent DNA helicase DinG
MQNLTPVPQTAALRFTSPTLCFGAGKFVYLNGEGEILELSAKEAARIKSSTALLVCHAPYTHHKLGHEHFETLDILELYAFVYPMRFCVPTPVGLAKSLQLDIPEHITDYPMTLLDCASTLLHDLTSRQDTLKICEIASVMGLNGKGWKWAPYVFKAMGQVYDPTQPILSSRNLLNVWGKLPEWAEDAPMPPPSHHPVTGDETRERLASLLTTKRAAEARPEQVNYATRLAESFRPPEAPEQPHVTLAEAGTGVGKTLGYLAPASVWAEKNTGSVTISTYTKNLQRQISTEIERIYPDPTIRESKVTVRKGRENYVCLLNFEDLAASAALAHGTKAALSAGLMARWIMETPDGDLTGNSFHGWLPGVIGTGGTLSLADKRGECIFSACDHYHRCFSERIIRKAQRTPIVIANHAVVMIKASHHDDDLSPHLIFDEGHHVFDAADSAFSAALTGIEAHDLRRWLVGPDGGRKSRARGLKKRVEDLIEGDQDCLKSLDAILHHASFLPTHDWLQRGRHENIVGEVEQFLIEIYRQVWARCGEERDAPYSLETQVFPLSDAVFDAAMPLLEKLKSLRAPIQRLSARLKQKLAEETETLSPDSRKRLESVSASLDRRISSTLSPWIEMLDNLQLDALNPDIVDWMEIERVEGKIIDVGLHRHYIDPTKALAAALKPQSHSITMTSATLKEENGEDWGAAESLTGAHYMNDAPLRFSIPSPYNYAEQTRVFIVTDVSKTDMAQLSAAYQHLFMAAGGGALGLFTSIQRLKSVHKHITQPLSENGLTLYAQHIDGIDTGTLVDMFRDDTHSCLLGTDAVRDGVDVPGESLRLIAFDRVPWPRATILQRERKKVFGGSAYDDRLTRLKLKQAYGRLVRTATDRGVFVMLDSAMPSRLLNAFPDGVKIERLGIAEAIEKSREFLSPSQESNAKTVPA